MATLMVLTAVGEDRPGLVEAIAEAVAGAGGSWLESRMSRLASRFAGILLIRVADGDAERLRTALLALEAHGLRVTLEDCVPAPISESHRMVRLEVVGQDRAGIVHQIAEALAAQRISIDDLVTEVESASWSGERLCRLSAEIRLPEGTDIERLRTSLEVLANELMVDLFFDNA